MSDDVRYTRDCGDKGCIFRDRSTPGGVRTNGGCAHLKETGPQLYAQLRAMAAEILRLRSRVADPLEMSDLARIERDIHQTWPEDVGQRVLYEAARRLLDEVCRLRALAAPAKS